MHRQLKPVKLTRAVPSIVMEYCAGGALHNLVHNQTCPKRFSIVAPILQDVANAMEVRPARHPILAHIHSSA